MKKSKDLTDDQRNKVILLTQKGYTMVAIKRELGVSINVLKRFFTKWRPENYTVIPVIMNPKQIPYYENENDYADLPDYKWEDLSQSEIDLYLKKN